MPIGKYQIDGSEVEVQSEMLDLPYTMPDNGSGYQVLSVVEDMNDDCEMHVNFAAVLDYPESWGRIWLELHVWLAITRTTSTSRNKKLSTLCAPGSTRM